MILIKTHDVFGAAELDVTTLAGDEQTIWGGGSGAGGAESKNKQNYR